MPSESLWAVALFLLTTFIFFRLRISRNLHPSRLYPFPPGPRGFPLVGNLFDIPTQSPWLGYRKLCQRYGNLVYLNVLGRSMLILNDPKDVTELFEKRSAIYSSRMELNMINLTGWEWNLGFLPYGDTWRRHRRMFWQYFRPEANAKYVPVARYGAHQFLSLLLEKSASGDVMEKIRYSLGGSIIRTVFGLSLAKTNDKYIKMFEEAVDTVELIVHGVVLEYFPVLAGIPTWLPGTGYLKELEDARRLTATMRDVPFEDARSEVNAGVNTESIITSIIHAIENGDDETRDSDLTVAKNVTAVAYGGLTLMPFWSLQRDWIPYSALAAFFLAMSLYPEVQQRAREELDRVIGPTRLPELSDRDQLPYLNAVLKEALRWHVPVPLSLPHMSTEEDVYQGHRIPKGTIVIPNTWAMLHDPEVFPEPERFMPERFLKNGQIDGGSRDPTNLTFGFGRRICPGRYFAESTLFIYMACVLHTLDISPPLDEQGQPIRIEPRPTNNIISFMEDCRCSVKARSSGAEALIKQYAEARVDVSHEA